MSDAVGLSIIICTWNREVPLQATLQSLNAQTHCEPNLVEVIVVDNNSSDATKKIVTQLIPEWRLGSLRYAFEPRQGKQFALNLGINLCTHAIVAFSDDDIIFSQNWVSEILRIFATHDLDLVGGKTLISWPPTGKPNWYHRNMAAVLGEVDLGETRIQPAPPEYSPAGANMIARRSLFERIGGFSEAHYRHMDFEFGMRSHMHAVKIAYEPSILVYAPVDDACLTKRYFRRWAFKAGITQDAESPVSQAKLLGVPLWTYRQVFEDLLVLLLRRSRKTPSEEFNRELRAWRGMGKIASSWHERLRPTTHTQWVQGFSQKKNNVY